MRDPTDYEIVAEGLAEKSPSDTITVIDATNGDVSYQWQTGGTVSDTDAQTSSVSFADTDTSQAVTPSETSSVIIDDA